MVSASLGIFTRSAGLAMSDLVDRLESDALLRQ
jgi:hypothetical protein